MVLHFSLWMLALFIAIGWVSHIVLSTAPSAKRDAMIKQLLIAQANRLFYSLLALPLVWVANNVVLFNMQLTFLVWVVRVVLGLLAIKQIIFFFIGLTSIRKNGEVVTTISNVSALSTHGRQAIYCQT